MKKFTTFLLLLANLFTCYAQETISDGCNCPEPTPEQFSNVCLAIYQKAVAHNSENGLSFSYQENLWEMSCAEPGKDTPEEAKQKIQCMWNKYREKFRCYDYPTSIATDKNITKFSLDTGFTVFLNEAVRKLNLDMNFIDPEDQKTILDFIEERETYIRRSEPVDIPKADEYHRLYQLLNKNGAKHSWELNN